jgi:hypothetical protein
MKQDSILPLSMLLILWINSIEITFGAIVMISISVEGTISAESSMEMLQEDFKECNRNYMTICVYIQCFSLLICNLMSIFKMKRMEIEIEEA